jgi:hypothetical protein
VTVCGPRFRIGVAASGYPDVFNQSRNLLWMRLVSRIACCGDFDGMTVRQADTMHRQSHNPDIGLQYAHTKIRQALAISFGG